MEITQANLDSLAEKLADFTEEELAALHFTLAAVAEQSDDADDEVEGFRMGVKSTDMSSSDLFRTLAPARFGDITLQKGILGTTYGGDGVVTEEIV